MQLTHGEWNTKWKEIASTAGRHEGISPTPKGTMKTWAGLGILILLFLASLAYGAFRGTLAFEASPIPEPETSIASVPVITGDVGGAPINEKASSGSVQPADYLPAAYPNRGRDGDGNVMTYEHD